MIIIIFFFQAEDGIRDYKVTGVQTCALPISAPWKYSYMLGGMVSLCSLAMCLRTISEYRKRSPQMRQCHWSRANMYGRHSELFGSSLGSGILTSPESDAVPRSRRLRSETPSFFEALIPKLADPDSSCVNSSGTSIAKKYSGPMRYGHSAQAPTWAKMSQALRSLV